MVLSCFSKNLYKPIKKKRGMPIYDVITVGSATIDVFAKTESELIKIKTREHEDELIAYPAGSKILIERLDFQTGGGGTNTAVSFARLGLKTAFLGKIGKDCNGGTVISELRKEKVEFIGVTSREQTGYSIVLNSIEEDRTILTFKGANNCLGFNEINKGKLKAKWFYFSSMVDKSYKTLEKIAMYAKKNNIKVAFNPSSYLTKNGTAFLASLVRNTDLLVLNREEAEMLVGNRPAEELLKELSALGPSIVAITDGKNGVYALEHGENGKHKIYYLPGNKVKVVETTGAGDAFASGFLAGLILKNDTRFALNLGIANATSVVMHLGAKNRLLTLSEAKRMIAKNKRIKTIKA
jgi:ribokinase